MSQLALCYGFPFSRERQELDCLRIDIGVRGSRDIRGTLKNQLLLDRLDPQQMADRWCRYNPGILYTCRRWLTPTSLKSSGGFPLADIVHTWW